MKHNPMPVSGYTKLFGSIIASTIWREKKETKIVWITMLAMANKNGIVEGSVPGLADMARISVEETREALRVLSSPDRDSRSKVDEGRRIREVDGGWFLINHGHYRAKLNSDERREYLNQKQRECRERRQQKSTTVNTCIASSTLSTHTEAESTTEAEEVNQEMSLPEATDEASRVTEGSHGVTEYTEEFESLWSIYPNTAGKKKAFSAYKRLSSATKDRVRADILLRVNSRDWLKDGGQFVPMLATYLNGERWNDPLERTPVNQPKNYEGQM